MKVVATWWLLLAASTCIAGSVHAEEPGEFPGRQIRAFLSEVELTPASAEALSVRCNEGLALGSLARTALESRQGSATIENDFVAYDALVALLGDANGEMKLVADTHVVAEVRDAAQACVARLSEATTDVSLSRPIYERLAAIPRGGLDAETGFALDRELAAYRRAGVDLDEATRAGVAELQKQATETGLAFAKNIRDDKGDMAFAPEELAGMPEDWLATRKPGDDGLIHLTYDYPDTIPVLRFAQHRDTRRKAMLGLFNRGYPANKTVLESLLQQRYELARMLGHPDYASLVISDKMIGSSSHAARFIEDADAAAQAGADADFAELDAFAKDADPAIDRMQLYDNAYFYNLLRKQKYDVDAAEVRRYFTYDKARAGIFELMGDLFGADIRPWDTPVWHESVSAWELYDGGQLIGRFYLDMHPREGKFNHAAAFPIRVGVAGQQVAHASLVCNFPADGPMEHGDVVTFLHEFGHLIHMLYSGRTQYAAQWMGSLQWDFIEAPSQLLEEWAWDYDTLKRFASDESGNPIPQALVQRMNAGRDFGAALGQKQQLAYAAISLNYYNRPPGFDLKEMADAQSAKYLPFPPIDELHAYASFGHLDGYSAIYYTYVWSKAIALDLFTRFSAAGIRDKEVATLYRQLVLEPGGSRDANDLIESFLGRPLSLDAYKDYLQKRDAE
ncbi:MAG: Zn-dependent oligopeptidase [Luteimonas sp.]|nr:Zn-dependent oligopeptidase [Luteimonas sp.]